MIKELETRIVEIDSEIESIHKKMTELQEQTKELDVAGKAYIADVQQKMQILSLQINESVNKLSPLAQEKYQIEGKIQMYKDIHSQSKEAVKDESPTESV